MDFIVKPLREFFEDASGGLSSMRLAFVLGYLSVIGVWVYVSIQQISMIEVPNSVLVLLGTITAAKIWQRNMENEPPKTP